MKRGDIVRIADRAGDFSGKPRPGLIVQADVFNAIDHHSVSVCPITTLLIGSPLFRFPVQPSDENGLREVSEVEIDKIQAIRSSRVGDRIGSVSEQEMTDFSQSLRRWLDL